MTPHILVVDDDPVEILRELRVRVTPSAVGGEILLHVGSDLHLGVDRNVAEAEVLLAVHRVGTAGPGAEEEQREQAEPGPGPDHFSASVASAA